MVRLMVHDFLLITGSRGLMHERLMGIGFGERAQ